MAARTGSEYVQRLKAHPREVWLQGRRIDDVTAEPVFTQPLRSIARLFDLQSDPAHRDVLTYHSPATGERVATAFMPSHSYDDLVKRREAFRVFSEATFGLMGRSQDFMNCVLLAFAEARDLFARGGEQYASNIVDYYTHIRDNDLFLTHAIVSPQTDRSKTSAGQADEFLHLGVVRETTDGIIVRGARMLATLGPIADEVLVYNLPTLQAGDERHALVFGLAIDAPGLRQICREPFDQGDRSSFDHPLAAHFEECDSMLIFDDVLVPWERVFVYRDVDIANTVFPQSSLRHYSAHQSGVRGLVKMQLAVGLAMALARAVKTDHFLHVQEMLGECLNYVEVTKSCIYRAERDYDTTPAGTVRPLYEPLQAVRTLLPRWYPRVIEVMQVLGAGGLLMMPTAGDLNSAIAGDIERYYQGAEGMSGTDRTRLFKLAWDLCGDSFGSRQLQYERYYAGDPVRSTAGNYSIYDSAACDALVQRALELAGDP